MMITAELKERVKEIKEMSLKLQGSNEEDSKYILNAIVEHADEIRELFGKNDSHYVNETADMIILCIELLMTNNINPDDPIKLRLNRFVEKIAEASK